MCGIAGYIGATPPLDDRTANCLSLMNRRGPDCQRVEQYHLGNRQTVVLLHSRLSIIDPDPRGGQPMSLDTCHLALNGEIYNYRELRDELEALGHEFRTRTDTEVLLHLLAEEGVEALDRCEGMWAFAYLDEDKHLFVLCRDRFGEKPLFVHRCEHGLYFGSEPKFIFALLGHSLPVNRRQIARYLVNGYKSLYKQSETFFEGLTELTPGMVLIQNGNGESIERRYWSPRYEQCEDMTAAEAATGLQHALARSVELRLRADVPLAFCMSGGIDSNCLISIAKKVCDFDVHGFTVVNTDARYEERDKVDHMVKTLGLRHTEVPIDATGFLPKLTELVHYHDAPIYTISYYVHWQMMQRMHELGYRVSISGTAADELFTGYYDHHCFYLAEAGDAAAETAWARHVKPIVRNPYLQSPDRFVINPDFRGHIYLGRAGFAALLRIDEPEDFFEARFTSDTLRNRLLNEMFHEVVPVILHEDDLNAMYYSIENRSPFLDRALFEFAQSIPTRLLIRDGYGKVVLRDAMQGIVPDSVLWNRRKVGFNAPVAELLRPESPETKQWFLADSPLFDVIDRDRFAPLLEQAEIPNSLSKFLFNACGAKIFLEKFS